MRRREVVEDDDRHLRHPEFARRHHPEWLTISRDGKNLYVAIAGEDVVVVVVNNQTMKVVKTIPVGAVPKRNTSGMLSTE